MTTLREIREALSDAKSRTTFFPRINETYYPAAWSWGEGAGDASTSCKYDRRIQLAAEWVACEYGLHLSGAFDDCTRLRDCADIIASALRRQNEHDEAVDATLDAPIGVD